MLMVNQSRWLRRLIQVRSSKMFVFFSSCCHREKLRAMHKHTIYLCRYVCNPVFFPLLLLLLLLVWQMKKISEINFLWRRFFSLFLHFKHNTEQRRERLHWNIIVCIMSLKKIRAYSCCFGVWYYCWWW